MAAGQDETTEPLRLFQQAVACRDAGDLAQAERLYRRVLASGPGRGLTADVLANLGGILAETLQLGEAEVCLREAVRLSPKSFAALRNLGELYHLTQRDAEAEVVNLRALACRPEDPGAATALGVTYLALGRYDLGWPLYEFRWPRRTCGLFGLSFPEWDGSPLEGRSVFVWREQGYGDEIQMARFIPQLRAAGAGRITVAPTLALMRIFNTLEGDPEIIRLVGEVRVSKHDVWVLPASLPQRLGVKIGDIPSAPYLRAPDEARARWAGAMPKRAAGVVWHGNPKQPVERHRGLSSSKILQPLAEQIELVDLQEPRGDFADTAALLEQLDLVITTDTAMAHLAGAMGVPCWVMLPALAADWRWTRGDRTPWYPNTRLWRQTSPGEWSDVIARMAAALAAGDRA